MSTTLEINAIRDYLIEVGFKIEYPILVNAFKKHLYNPDPNVQGRIRTQFKDYVNTLATVSIENNMKFINLRQEFMPPPPPLHDNNKQQQQQQQQVFIGSGVGTPISAKPINEPSPPPANTKQTVSAKQQKLSTNIQRSLQSSQPPPIPQHQRPPPPPVAVNSNSKQQQKQSQFAQKPSSQQHQQSGKLHSSNNNGALQQQQQKQFMTAKQMISDENNRPHQQLNHDVQDGNVLMPPPSPPISINGGGKTLQHQRHQHQPQMQRPESLNLSSSQSMPPPRPPPRRRQSTASLFKQSPKPIDKTSREIHELAKKSPGKVREHALKFMSSSNDVNVLMPPPIMMMRSNTLKENRLSRDSTIGSSLSSALSRNNLQLTSRSRSSHREDESDSSSLQPIDPLRRKWAIEACNCNYNGLLTLLREDTKLAYYKDIANGYTALHWAAKFGNLDIIKLIAGTHGVSPNIKSSSGYTPLHVAAIFNRTEAADLLLKSYKANPDVRDHSGKRPKQYWNYYQNSSPTQLLSQKTS